MSNVFIFTLAGKPIFSRYGDEFALSPVLATFSAIIPKICSFYSNESFFSADNLVRNISAKGFTCQVLIKQ